MDYRLFYTLGIALGLGLLVGLQRERSGSKVAGIRTFPLITMMGSISAFIAEELNSGWIVAAFAIGMALIVLSANYIRAHDAVEHSDAGQTTEVAVLLMFGLGAYLAVGSHTIGVAVGAVTAILLHLKGTLGQMVDRLGEKDMRAIMQFAAISLIILPILPNETYGPFSVLNPREIWLMVVLIVGLSVTAYFIYKLVGEHVGTIAGGILGGLISSTATTVTYARRTKGEEVGRLAAFVIATASAVAFLRVIAEVAIVIPHHLGVMAPPLLAIFLFMALLCAGLYFFRRGQEEEGMPEPSNPAQLKPALIFGALYALIILAVAVAKEYFGDGGLYVVSIISGLTDVDAITLSLSNTIGAGNLEPETGWKLILIAALSNLAFKGGMAVVLGSRRLATYVLIVFAITMAAGLLVLWLWPEGWAIESLENLVQGQEGGEAEDVQEGEVQPDTTRQN